ncbi:hypothetical protein ACFLWA_12195 [Chloroflexota bacterium]
MHRFLYGRTTLIIDNGSPVEEAFGALVAKNSQRYGVRPANVSSGKFGGVNPGVGKLWESTVNYLQAKGYERIFVIMHMSQVWTNSGPVPNKYKVKGNKTLNRLPNLSPLLVPDDRSLPNSPIGSCELGLARVCVDLRLSRTPYSLFVTALLNLRMPHVLGPFRADEPLLADAPKSATRPAPGIRQD